MLTLAKRNSIQVSCLKAVLGQADVPLSTPSKSFILPTDQPIWEETPAPTRSSSTEGSTNAVTEIATTSEPYVPNDATAQPGPDRSDATTVAPTTPPIPQATNVETAPPTTQPTNTTTAPLTTQPTNTTTAPLTTQPTNTTTAPLTTQPTNTTTAPLTTQPTNTTTAPLTTQPTNTTTAPLTTQPTNTTTAPAPTTPPLPEVGDYVVRAEQNASACLMARMGLQFSFRMGDSFQTINLNPYPNVTKTNGTCGDSGSDSVLVLISDEINVHFVFTNQTSKFFLSALSFTVVTGSGSNFTAVNTNLSLWEASLGSSYMCKKEQSFNITDALILNTFDLQVQPFGVTNDKFSTAHECSMDDTSLLIPIIVGAALAVLILIVVIAYVIGRRKTYVGYQTL
ncbi:hypothetical protein QTP86_002755 [Hemibagrus guttatus]|nr:hypothetical protein QTP86_002755 [Hemibagrus guttatus]